MLKVFGGQKGVTFVNRTFLIQGRAQGRSYGEIYSGWDKRFTTYRRVVSGQSFLQLRFLCGALIRALVVATGRDRVVMFHGFLGTLLDGYFSLQDRVCRVGLYTYFFASVVVTVGGKLHLRGRTRSSTMEYIIRPIILVSHVVPSVYAFSFGHAYLTYSTRGTFIGVQVTRFQGRNWGVGSRRGTPL